MIYRTLKSKIIDSLNNFPVVGIIGPRQVGKTTLAKSLIKDFKKEVIYLDLELPSDLFKLQESELFLKQYSNSLVIIDEIQRAPEIFPIIRALVDQDRTNGRFLILGSASPKMIKQSSESLAGRIKYHELAPFYIKEISDLNINDLWIRGGYPKSFLAENLSVSLEWRDSFIKTFLERDLPQLGIHISALQIRRFWTIIAHNHGNLWNASSISNSLGISSPTVKHYLDLLESTFIIRQLQPYHANLKKRLIKSPKIYIRDTGLLHSLLKITNIEDLYGNPIIGSSWEGFVIEQIINLLPDYWEYYFYRTNAGAEIDLILIPNNQKSIAIEIKNSLSPKISKGFWIAFNDLSCRKGYIIYPGSENFPIANNISTLPISMLDYIINDL